ncbi:ferric reductase like transmembrane component-domain-containing protein [Rhexocercosporidium sp. MPI-PUGE-AT-0058]|nr:ferric reductase like transmembrane component-domain-containing protein [Rhexocercosporidium sp. MPI-PUGE-AT-0058]
MATFRQFISSLLLFVLQAQGVNGDGIGLIGWGKTLYNPTCTFACRYAIRSQSLACTPTESSETFGTAHHSVKTPPSCYVADLVFLKTVALCIDTYCPLAGNPPLSLVKSYWAGHLATGTLGTPKYIPALSYEDALGAARADEVHAASGMNLTTGNTTNDEHSHMKIKIRQHDSHGAAASSGMKTFDVSSPLPTTIGGKVMLNVTSFVDPEVWQMGYNYMLDFEINEAGHSTTTIVIAIFAIFIPIFLSLCRFIPGLGRNSLWNTMQSRAVYPALWGSRHRVPVAGAVIPTRGQSVYLFLISFLNVILLLAPYVHHRPQASFSTLGLQTLSIVGNRAGSMAMGNVVVLFLFAARNNPLLYITDWSYGTYLLLHRWLGYWAIIQTIIHSFMLMANYMVLDMYKVEFARNYWSWGIVGTVCACAILPFSHLWVRQKFYELFLLTHIVFSLLFLIAYYYHIWYLYKYNWGYEIWMFVAGGMWGADRVVRLLRMALHGSRTAVVSSIQGADREYIRIDIEGREIKGGVAYLCFPTLGWRFCETHPFSVAFSDNSIAEENSVNNNGLASTSEEPTPHQEKSEAITNLAATNTALASTLSRSKHCSTTFIARARTGVTKQLLDHISREQGSARIRVLIDGPYHHSGHVSSQLAPCSSIICIAGGVGITACLPYLKKISTKKPANLYWSSRKSGLVTELGPILAVLPSNVKVIASIGERFDLDAVLSKELASSIGEQGLLGVVVCGPPGMADDVRQKISEVSKSFLMSRPYVLVDEAFSW